MHIIVLKLAVGVARVVLSTALAYGLVTYFDKKK
jgi:hypothetical protein